MVEHDAKQGNKFWQERIKSTRAKSRIQASVSR